MLHVLHNSLNMEEDSFCEEDEGNYQQQELFLFDDYQPNNYQHDQNAPQVFAAEGHNLPFSARVNIEQFLPNQQHQQKTTASPIISSFDTFDYLTNTADSNLHGVSAFNLNVQKVVKGEDVQEVTPANIMRMSTVNSDVVDNHNRPVFRNRGLVYEDILLTQVNVLMDASNMRYGEVARDLAVRFLNSFSLFELEAVSSWVNSIEGFVGIPNVMFFSPQVFEYISLLDLHLRSDIRFKENFIVPGDINFQANIPVGSDLFDERFNHVSGDTISRMITGRAEHSPPKIRHISHVYLLFLTSYVLPKLKKMGFFSQDFNFARLQETKVCLRNWVRLETGKEAWLFSKVERNRNGTYSTKFQDISETPLGKEVLKLQRF